MRNCDIVMKGGVTSGVVYPDAIHEIAQTFDLKSIGGTSAGAIAAALAAAAQYRRLRCRNDPALGDGESGYEHLRTIPEFLGRDDHLFKLFAPNRATKSLFSIVVDLFAPKRGLAQKLTSLLRAYPAYAVAGLVPAAAYGLAIADMRDPQTRGVHTVLAALVAAVGAVGASGAGLAFDLLAKLPRNEYGLVTGVDDADPANDVALCTWLTAEIERIAGLEPGAAPLTFGMLWDPSKVPGAYKTDDPPPLDERQINLQMVTTSLTEGRPYQFPMRTNGFHFSKAQLRKFFPQHVVDWMERHQRTGAAQYADLVPMPPISDLPIIVATRMSLAFPLLLSAVPLYAVDHTDPDPQKPQQVWFSDGGLTSNFPISMFDAPLPRWPTLALNLGTENPRKPKETVILIERYSDGRLLRFQKIGGLAGFFGAMFGAVQNWNDNMQATVPGVRDRIATIVMRRNEGGLNLDMDAQTIASLRERGRQAGRALVERFKDPSELQPGTERLSWEGHRWTRFRVALSCLQDHLGAFSDVFTKPDPGDVPYEDLITATNSAAVPMQIYALQSGNGAPQAVADTAKQLAETGKKMMQLSAIAHDTPRPVPGIVTRPNIDE